MRQSLTSGRLREFMRRLGRSTTRPLSVFITGGGSAVLTGWRESTIDVDLRVEPEDDDLLRAMVRLKTEMDLNVELASPSDFIPPVPGWRERSRFIDREGSVSFFHYDFYAQALAKIDRGHDKDLDDVRAMLVRGLVEPAELRRLFDLIEPEMFRYPALDPDDLRHRIEQFLNEAPATT